MIKQVGWFGSLLVVPVVAWLIWLTSGNDPRERQPNASASPAPAGLEVQPTEGNAPAVPPRGETKSNEALTQAPEPELAAGFSDDDPEEESDPVEESRRIRLPVIQALRANHPTPQARREAMLDALRNSGESDEAWTKQSVEVFDEWMRGISTDVGLRPNWSSAQCYQAGCTLELSFPNRASYERAAKEFRSLQEEGANHGGRVQTPAVESESGELVASWIMMRPDGSRS